MKTKKDKLNYFKSAILPLLKEKYSVSEPNPSSFVIYGSHFGPMTVYPQKNKLQIHQDCKWVSHAFSWLKENLLFNADGKIITLKVNELKNLIKKAVDDVVVRNVEIEDWLDNNL